VSDRSPHVHIVTGDPFRQPGQPGTMTRTGPQSRISVNAHEPGPQALPPAGGGSATGEGEVTTAVLCVPAGISPARRLAPAARRAAAGTVRHVPLRPHRQATIWEQTYPGTPDQVRRLRAALRQQLDACPVADDVLLLMDELAANAVRHSRSGQEAGTFTARLLTVPGEYVYGEVEDGGSSWDGDLLGSAREASGLFLVMACAAACGVAADGPARVVWFAVPHPGCDLPPALVPLIRPG
jgi:serine/threonine-protein kinase RsbW